MFKIATYFESSLGRNDGNPLYVTAFLSRVQHFCDVINKRSQNDWIRRYFPGGKLVDPAAEAFAKWFCETYDPEGLEVKHLRPHGDLKPWGTFDLNIDVDWGEDGLGGVLPYAPIKTPRPNLVWNSDTHLGFDYRLAKSKESDFVFCAQKRAVEEFKQHGVEAIWLPHAVEPLAYPKFNYVSKKTDICFVGHVNSENRLEALDRLFKEFPNFYYGQRRFEAASQAFNESKIVFNIAMKDDLNMRCFEAMGSGSFLLTDDIPTIHDLFQDKKHLVLYRNLDEMVELARYYITHDDEREAIAKAGYEEVISKHTFGHRMKAMIEAVMPKLTKTLEVA